MVCYLPAIKPIVCGTHLLCAAGAHQLVVDAALLDGINQIDHDLAIGYGRVVEVTQMRLFASLRQSVVDPLDDLLLDDGVAGVGQAGQNGQGVGAH